jgi:hypothetical protein
MFFSGYALRALALAWACAASGAALAATADFRGTAASIEARVVAERAAAGDADGRPFAVVDKKGARIHVFDARGRLVGTTPVLLGLALGDESLPGVGAKPVSAIEPDERTTAAGRFESEPGRNLDGEHVVWLDYDAGLAIHRLRPGSSYEPRARRLATPTPDDNRVSFGCVVVPVSFYEDVIMRVLGRKRSVVYVLPDTKPADVVFSDIADL